jgi:hypothetical protein
MSLPRKPNPAKLVVGLFMKDKDLVDNLAKELVDKIGPMDMVSSWFSFDYTDYYEPEMGTSLFRRMFAFKSLIEQNTLADIKILTNELELKYAKEGKRKVNIDPGYLTLERLVLATGKNFTHRIYLEKGIYADLTLIYQKGGFQKLPWTYPDYIQNNVLNFLCSVRRKYARDLKTKEDI